LKYKTNNTRKSFREQFDLLGDEAYAEFALFAITQAATS
jgi:hypothetical protein